MITFSERLAELTELMKGSDLSLATRRVMDLCDEFVFLHHFREEAMFIRADYNMSRELGASELSDSGAREFQSRLSTLLEQISEVANTEESAVAQTVPPSSIFTGIGLCKSFRSGGHHFRLGPIDIELLGGEITGLVGENGNGKTTLLRQIAGLLDHNEGSKEYSFAENDPYLIRQQLAWIPQRSKRWYGTLLQNLRFMASIHGILGKENEFRVDYTIHRLGLTRFRNLTWKQLSSGYKLRFELAKMLVWQPKLLVLDEPIANLDLQAQQLFLQDLRFLAGSTRNPVSIILSSQQLHQIETVADNIMFLRNGRSMYYGPTRGFDNDRSENVFELNGDFTREELANALGSSTFNELDDTGINFRLTTPRTVKAALLFEKLGKAQLQTSYFRDISTSTRKLFHQDP